jgi:hypothetical protein
MLPCRRLSSSLRGDGPPFLLVVATRAERDEVSQVEGRAAVRDGLNVVNLKPLAARAAARAGVPVAAERGLARALPFRCGANEQAGFTCGAALL